MRPLCKEKATAAAADQFASLFWQQFAWTHSCWHHRCLPFFPPLICWPPTKVQTLPVQSLMGKKSGIGEKVAKTRITHCWCCSCEYLLLFLLFLLLHGHFFFFYLFFCFFVYTTTNKFIIIFVVRGYNVLTNVLFFCKAHSSQLFSDEYSVNWTELRER